MSLLFLLGMRKGQPIDFVVGVLLSKVEHRKKERWNVQFGNTETQLLAKDFENAFPPGQRVLVNWQGSGEMLQGCVVQWDGGTRYKVWFDEDNKTYPVFGAELSLFDAPMPKSFPKKYHALIGEPTTKEKQIYPLHELHLLVNI